MNKLANLISNSGYDFYFLVVDEFLDINIQEYLPNFYQIYAYQKEGINSRDFCLESTGEKLIEKNTGRLISHPKVIEFIENNSAKTGHKIAIVPFKPSAKIDLVCQKKHWLNISNISHLNRELEDKVKFTEICEKRNIPIIPFEITTFTENNFKNIQSKFGQKLVIQTHFGWAGNSTHFSDSWDNIKNVIEVGQVVKITPYLDGYSLLNNCCLTKKGLIQSPPALQYTGIKEFTNNPFATVGRQWPCLAPLSIQQKVKDISEKFSKIIFTQDYKGFFGLDFFVDQKGNVFLLECNPRLTASFAFYTSIELHNKLTPLFYFHLLEFLNIPYDFDLEEEQSRFYNTNIVGSEITKKNSASQTVQKFNDFEAFTKSINPITFSPKILSHFEK